MNEREEEVRALIARQAADWFLAQREGSLGAREREAFDAWLLASPAHVDEYLGVTAVALALPTAADDPEFSLDVLLERARCADDAGVQPLHAGMVRTAGARARAWSRPRWQFAAAAAALVAVICGVFWWGYAGVAPQNYATGHGEQRSWPLPDNSVLHLNTDTAVAVRYGRSERLVELAQGQAYFEVAHEPQRRFRVAAGPVNVLAIGTKFDVHRDRDVTVVAVAEGRVIVTSDDDRPGQVPVSAGEELRVRAGRLPDRATPVDIQRSLAWLRRQIAFDQEPLAAVVDEFNRYGGVPIEVEDRSLRSLNISGVFNAGDTDTFVAFLRTLDGVTVAATPEHIRVSRARPVPSPARGNSARTSVSSGAGD